MHNCPDPPASTKPSVSVVIFLGLLFAISLLYLLMDPKPWYRAQCPLTAAHPGYEARLKAGLDPNQRVAGAAQQDMDLIIWHLRSGDCGDDVSEFLLAKKQFGGALNESDIQIATRLYQDGALNLASYDLILQFAADPQPGSE